MTPSSKSKSNSVRLTELNQLIRGREIVDGVWTLTGGHEIEYRRQNGEQEVLLSGNLVAAEETGLVIQVRERSTEQEVISRTLTLRGRWEADSQNRLTFLVERQSDRNDRLTLAGGWEVGGSNEILYRFSRINLETKQQETHTLTFRGHWDLDGSRRLTYLLDEASDSSFRFRGTFQSPSILAKEGAIRYQIGVELAGRRRLQTVTLFGKWKLSRDLSVEFEIPYGDRSTRALTFGAAYAFDSQSTIAAQLTTRRGEPLGVEVVFTREFLKGQGEAFVRLRKSLEESAVEGGFRFRW